MSLLLVYASESIVMFNLRFSSLGSTVVRIVSSAGSMATTGETWIAMRGVPCRMGAPRTSAPKNATSNNLFIVLLPSRRRDAPLLPRVSGVGLQDCSIGCYTVVVNTSPDLCLNRQGGQIEGWLKRGARSTRAVLAARKQERRYLRERI